MNEDENVMIVCNPKDAEKLVEIDNDVSPVLIVCEALTPGNVFIVKQKDFMSLLEKGDLMVKEDNRENNSAYSERV